MYDFEILHSEILGDGCTKEYIPLGTPSAIFTPTPATIRMQPRDIQSLEHEAEADLECVR